MEGAFRDSDLGNRGLAVTGAEIKRESGAFRRGVFQVEQAAVFLYDRITDRQSQARSCRLGREIGVENLWSQIMGNAGATVGHGDLDVMARWQKGGWLVIENDIARPDTNRSAVRHRLAGV